MKVVAAVSSDRPYRLDFFCIFVAFLDQGCLSCLISKITALRAVSSILIASSCNDGSVVGTVTYETTFSQGFQSDQMLMEMRCASFALGFECVARS